MTTFVQTNVKTYGAFSAHRLCVARRNGDTETLRFADGKHVFYAEQRCTRTFHAITDADVLCQVCRDSKYTVINGLVSGPIPDVSHMYGGAWYNKKVLIWGEPSAEHLAIAKKMQERCRTNALNNGLTIKTTLPEAKTTEPVAAPKIRKFKVVKSAPSVPSAESSSASEPEEAAPLPPKTAAAAAAFFKGKVRKMKVAKQEPVQPSSVQPLAIESTESPLIVGDLDENGNEFPSQRNIFLKKIYVPFFGHDVYLDTESENAYEIMPDGGVGKKIEDDYV